MFWKTKQQQKENMAIASYDSPTHSVPHPTCLISIPAGVGKPSKTLAENSHTGVQMHLFV